MSENQNWKPKVLILSGVIGGLLGLMAGLFYIRVAEESGGPSTISTSQVLKLALAAVGVVRQASQLGG